MAHRASSGRENLFYVLESGGVKRCEANNSGNAETCPK